jgi:SAM-dependent methyltransferase
VRVRVRFALGAAEAIPLEDKTIDLIWCRDVLVHVSDLNAAYTEMRRVLRDSGFALIYQMFWGDRLEPQEAAWLWRVLGNAPESAKPEATERAIETAGLTIRKRIELGSDWGEWAQETSGLPGRRLLHAARLLRDPDRYAQAYGRAAYDLKLADCLWHVYRMIGKLSPRIYVISPKTTC